MKEGRGRGRAGGQITGVAEASSASSAQADWLALGCPQQTWRGCLRWSGVIGVMESIYLGMYLPSLPRARKRCYFCDCIGIIQLHMT